MLDNLVGAELHSAAKALKEKYKGDKQFLIETSGGIVEGGLTGRVGPGECSAYEGASWETRWDDEGRILMRWVDIDILSTSAVHQVSPCFL